MTCTHCQQIIDELKLNETHFQMTTMDIWYDLVHDDLLPYADYNNGVSEDGTGFMCKTCYTFFDDHFHIAMEEDELAVKRLDKVDEWHLKAAAMYVYTESLTEQIKRMIEEKECHTVYTVTDMLGPIVYHHGTNEEKSMFELEIHQKYGINHEVFSVHAPLYLSLEDCIRDFGKNDDYVKKSFILSFDIKKEDINVYPLSSPYAETQVRISTDTYIPPEKLQMVDLQTGEKQILTLALLDQCIQRNEADYLALIRKKQAALPDILSDAQKEEKISEMMKTIQFKKQ